MEEGGFAFSLDDLEDDPEEEDSLPVPPPTTARGSTSRMEVEPQAQQEQTPTIRPSSGPLLRSRHGKRKM